MSANNKPVMPEAFAKGLRDLDDSSKISFDLLGMAGSANASGDKSKPNMVVQVNNSEESENSWLKTLNYGLCTKKLLTEANGINGDSIGLHPTTPHLVSWSRRY